MRANVFLRKRSNLVVGVKILRGTAGKGSIMHGHGSGNAHDIGPGVGVAEFAADLQGVAVAEEGAEADEGAGFAVQCGFCEQTCRNL